jgi:methylated-DNA-[protein]-cysteine S-methyltransferase
VTARPARRGSRAGPVDVGPLEVALVDVDTPLGTLTIAATRAGVVRIGPSAEDVLERLASRVVPDPVAASKRLDAARHQFDEYFAGRRRRFRVTLDWSLTDGFHRRALRGAARIPYGETATYGDVAAEIGAPRAARAVGTAMARNPFAVLVPCHRVVPASGGLGSYGGHPEVRAYLLELESRPELDGYRPGRSSA